jgi:hypothetical protein
MGESETSSVHHRPVCLPDEECLDGDLPWGWEEKTTENGTIFYVKCVTSVSVCNCTCVGNV